MCGIAGVIDPSLSYEESGKILHAMLECIAHRGPDSRGIYNDGVTWLGHNRLSIIDLSEEANQPFHYDEWCIIFNGEIYNYLEVKEKLLKENYHFSTHSDTEVILAAYKKWGAGCVHEFMGMWAFVIYNKKDKSIFVSRDRFGIKPFYYIYDGSAFYFASEIKALKKSPLFRSDLNIAQVLRGLQLGWTGYADETYFKYVKSLQAGHHLILKSGKVETKQYWKLDASLQNNYSEKEKADLFYAKFTDSVKMHMRSDVEVGGCLSGGLDSSAIASAVGTMLPDVAFKTFTIYYSGSQKEEVDERPFVYEVLKRYPQLEASYFSPTDADLPEAFERALYHNDVPFASSSPISQYFVMKLAASHKIKVLLDGQGSDEMLAGYMHSFYRLLGGLVSSFKISSALREFNGHIATQNFGLKKSAAVLLKGLMPAFMSEQQLYSYEYKNYFPFIYNDDAANFKLDSEGGSRLNSFLYQLMTTTSLPTLLHYEDRNSMAFSIESRVPFLDHRLVEFVFSLQDKDKFHRGITKRILRRSLQSIMPESITNRKDKKGFVTPGEVKWLRSSLSYLLESDFKHLSFLDNAKINSIVKDFKSGNNSLALYTWRLATLNHWLQNN